MKKVFIGLLFFCFCLKLNAQEAEKSIYLFSYFKSNGQDGLHLAYSKDGLKWEALKNDESFLKPTVSKDKLMRDPCIIRGGDGNFHMVWTVSWTDKTIGYAWSKDLVNWSEQVAIPVMAHEEDARNCWAPEITYDEAKKQYLIYWATTIKGKFPETFSEKDNGYNHRMYYTSTKDFKEFSKTKLLYNPGFNIIDATILKDGMQFIMFAKDETREPAQKNLKVAYSKKLKGPYSSASEPISGKYWAEGPTVIKKEDTWIVYFDKYTLHQYGAISSKDLKNWEDISDQISFPKGIRHGSIFTITEAELNKLK